MKINFSAFKSVLLLNCWSGLALSADFPAGYRYPDLNMLDFPEFRDELLYRGTVAYGDYDGDGSLDYAQILVGDKVNLNSIWVFFSSTKEFKLVDKLENSEGYPVEDVNDFVGLIDTVPSGVHQSHFECSDVGRNIDFGCEFTTEYDSLWVYDFGKPGFLINWEKGVMHPSSFYFD